MSVESIVQDIRYCFRMLRKNPGFSFIAILTLALGISANSAVFSLINGVLLRPLPVRDSDRVVAIATVMQRESLERRGTSYMDYLDWRARSTSFEEMASYTGESLSLTGAGSAEQIEAEAVSGSYFSVAGVKPVIGRLFLAREEHVPLADPPALLSHAFWTRHFGKTHDVLGTLIQLNEENFRIIGVLPEQFSGMDGGTELWIPMAAYTVLGEPKLVENRGTRQIDVMARLKPGATIEKATSEMAAIAKQLQKEYPETNQNYDAIVVSLRDEFFGETKPLLFTLLAAVLFVLLIACANVANLQVARATARQKEIALRTALGAGKTRILRQLLTESVLLSLLGGAFGWLLAMVFVKLLVVLNPVQLPAFVQIGLDFPVLLFTIFVCGMSGILMGLAPAYHASRQDLQSAMKESGASTTGGSAAKDVRNVLVIAEVALAVLLLIGAGLLARSFLRILTIPLGFSPQQRITMRVAMPRVKYEGIKSWQLMNLLLERIQAIPSVHSAAFTSDIPLGRSASASIFTLENPAIDRGIRAYHHAVTPEFFSTTGIALKSGRSFQNLDTPDSLPVAIVSEKMVQRYWKDENPIGKRLKFGRTASAERPWMTIVGVAAEVKHRDIVADVSDPDDPEIYLPFSQRVMHNVGLIVHTEQDPSSIVAALRQQVNAVDPDISTFEVITMEELVRNGTSGSRFTASLMMVFSVLALILSAIGIYGVLTFHVAQRTREIGVRLALGASPFTVFNMILRHALLLTAFGLLLGLFAAHGMSGLLAAQLYQVSPTDPSIFLSIPILLLLVSFLAILVPARRASRVDPIAALRAE